MNQLDLFGNVSEALAQPIAQARRHETTAEQLKRQGMLRAAMSKDSQLGYARCLAVDLARENGGECHADMVAEALEREGQEGLGNAAGSLFLGHVWEWTGRFVKSTRKQSHSNLLRVWRLKHG